MKTLGYTFWKEDSHWLGYLDEYPDYWTQGENEEELKKNLLDLHQDLSNGMIPSARKHAELVIA